MRNGKNSENWKTFGDLNFIVEWLECKNIINMLKKKTKNEGYNWWFREENQKNDYTLKKLVIWNIFFTFYR